MIYVVTRRNAEALIDIIETRKNSYKKQLEMLKKTHNNELLKRDELIKEYQDAVKKVEDEFKKREEDLSEKQKEEIKEVVIKTKGNPAEVRKMIEREFGINYVE